MATSSTSFPPGTSGNPKGRPPKSRTLTAIYHGRVTYPGTARADNDAPKTGVMRVDTTAEPKTATRAG